MGNTPLLNVLNHISYTAIGCGIGALGGSIGKYCLEKNSIYYRQLTYARVAHAGAIVFGSFVFAADLPILLKKLDNYRHTAPPLRPPL